MKAVLRGERHRFGDLVGRYVHRAHGIALTLVGNMPDAMDMVQEAFLKSLRAIETFDTTQRFFPWFYRILKNSCLSHIKRRRRLRKISLTSKHEDEPDIELPDLTFNPSALAVRDEIRERFWWAFGTLKTSDREILSLRHFQEMAYEEIARILEIPIGTVMSRLFHARRKLREKMERYL
ncbi:MAG: RNA polymerase sigma factor [Planctomycetota bacterium]